VTERQRPATADDAPALAALVRAGVETYRAFMPPGWAPVDHDPVFDPDRMRAHLALPGAWARVVDDGDGPMAFVLVLDDRDGDADAYLSSLFVAPPAWGRGLGRSLLAGAMEEMRRRDDRTARLWCARDYDRVRRLYEAAGWRATGAESLYELDCTPLVEYRVAL
jgi:GNAT superfamily N-acetyltransferase